MKILLITPETFGYELAIEKALVSRGHEVHRYPHICGHGNIYKVLYRFLKPIMKFHYYKYLMLRIDKKSDYEKIVIIKGEGVSSKLLLSFKKYYKRAEIIFYNWDSFKNNRLNSKELVLYDKIKSFDSNDCEKNEKIEHLPLFYSNEFKLKEIVDNEFIFYFAGTLHSERYKEVKSIISLFEDKKGSFTYFYCQSKAVFFLKKLIGKIPRNICKSEVGFKAKSKDELRKCLSKSICVIDFAHKNQNGLTMRTIEAIGMKKKIITNNCSVIKYDFYNENNIYVLGKSKGTLKEFISKPYIELPETIYNYYDINNWVLRLID